MSSHILNINPDTPASDLFNEAALMSGHVNSISLLLAEMGSSECSGTELSGTLYAIAKLNEIASSLYNAAYDKQRHQQKGGSL